MKLYADLHIHSCLSPCGDELMTPNNIVGMAYLKGLDVIAVCDHNCARNLPAVREAAQAMGLVLLPGMELTTREEAHMLCYFEDVETCLAFSEWIYAYLPDIPNRPRYFGEQLVMNGQDEIIASEERLLISALDLSFEACAGLIREHGGLCVRRTSTAGQTACSTRWVFCRRISAMTRWRYVGQLPVPGVDLAGGGFLNLRTHTGWRISASGDLHSKRGKRVRARYLQRSGRIEGAGVEGCGGRRNRVRG